MNPKNDADDIAKILLEIGFEVKLVKDASLESMEKAISEFAISLKGADTGLFCYSGHGVAVEGINYLVPITPVIDSPILVKSRAVAVDVIVGKMESIGVRTALIFLDCCRDNPFPGAYRSGSRGLAVVSAPKTTNSLIAYATGPGDVAQDGSGRNGVFSGAFINQLRIPGLELNKMMKNVKTDVAVITSNKQNPRVDDGMKEDFYFVSMEAIFAKARNDRDKAMAELDLIESQIAARSKAIASTKSAAEKSKLEIEQQKQKALEAAKRLELEISLAEVSRLESANSIRKADEEARLKMNADENAQAISLKKLADARRLEYEQLKRSDDSLEAFLKEIASLESALIEITSRYKGVSAQSEAEIIKFYEGKASEVSKTKAEAWENVTEYNTRTAKEQAKLIAQRDSEIAKRKSVLAFEQQSNEQELRLRLNKVLSELALKRFLVRGDEAQVQFGIFDRDKKQWPISVRTMSQQIPFSIDLFYSVEGKEDISIVFASIDKAIKAGAFTGEVEYSVRKRLNYEQIDWEEAATARLPKTLKILGINDISEIEKYSQIQNSITDIIQKRETLSYSEPAPNSLGSKIETEKSIFGPLLWQEGFALLTWPGLLAAIIIPSSTDLRESYFTNQWDTAWYAGLVTRSIATTYLLYGYGLLSADSNKKTPIPSYNDSLRIGAIGAVTAYILSMAGNLIFESSRPTQARYQQKRFDLIHSIEVLQKQIDTINADAIRKIDQEPVFDVIVTNTKIINITNGEVFMSLDKNEYLYSFVGNSTDAKLIFAK